MLVVLLLALLAPPAAAAPWRAPVDGAVVRPFSVVPGAPFAAGQHRGADLAARPGERVRAACAGRVTFAGRVPGRGRAVSVRCGALVATHLGLATVAVRRGTSVRAGARVGTAGGGHVQLGARRAGERHGYVDPAALLRGPGAPPLGPAPPGRTRPRVPPPVVRPVPAARPVAAPRRVPAVAWVGLGLVAAGLPLGALGHRRRRRSAALGRPVVAG